MAHNSPAHLAAATMADANPSVAPERTTSPGQARTALHNYFQTADGTRLFYRYWPAAKSGSPAIILLHRGHEHSGRVQHIVDELKLPDFAIFAWDARDHGRSVSAVNSPDCATLVKDLDSFAHHISSAYGISFDDIAVVGQSVSSVLAAAWVHDYAPKIRCMILSAPAFRIKLYAPFAHKALRLLYRLRGEFQINSYVKPRALTRDPERIASYKADPLITRPISVRLLLSLDENSRRIVKDAKAILVPTQILTSGRDWVVRKSPQAEFFARLGAAVKEQYVFNGFYHDILGEKERHLPLTRLRTFLLTLFAAPCPQPHLLDADKRGYTKIEFDELSRPLSFFSARRLPFALLKLGLWVGSFLSKGIRLGFKTGFDSGSTLDYVYRDQASGATPIRRFVDRQYLNAIGWKGIRRRKEHLIQALLDCIRRLHAADTPVRILDVAAGHGRYVLEALEQSTTGIRSVLLRDFSGINVGEGRRLIEEKNLTHLVHFEQGDAFDRRSLAAICPRPTLAIVSGLYELFPENPPVRESLTGLAEAVEPGGFLIYTGQPYHPQLEIIARALPSHRDFRPWVMRRRTQAEIDQLVEAAGFLKIDQKIDEWGIFTVSIAQRSA